MTDTVKLVLFTSNNGVRQMELGYFDKENDSEHMCPCFVQIFNILTTECDFSSRQNGSV